jgi:hypothetical protein
MLKLAHRHENDQASVRCHHELRSDARDVDANWSQSGILLGVITNSAKSALGQKRTFALQQTMSAADGDRAANAETLFWFPASLCIAAARIAPLGDLIGLPIYLTGRALRPLARPVAAPASSMRCYTSEPDAKTRETPTADLVFCRPGDRRRVESASRRSALSACFCRRLWEPALRSFVRRSAGDTARSQR